MAVEQLAQRNVAGADAGRALELDAHPAQVVYLFAQNLGGKAELAAYVNRFVPVDTTGLEVRFIDYDWSLNMTAPRDGRWVAARSGGASLHAQPGKTEVGRADAGTVFRVRKEDAGWLMVDRPFEGGVAWLRSGATTPFVLADR